MNERSVLVDRESVSILIHGSSSTAMPPHKNVSGALKDGEMFAAERVFIGRHDGGDLDLLPSGAGIDTSTAQGAFRDKLRSFFLQVEQELRTLPAKQKAVRGAADPRAE